MKFCTNCGQQMDDSAVFCSACGTRAAQVNAPAQAPLMQSVNNNSNIPQEAPQVVQEAPQIVQEAPQVVQEAPQVVQEAPQVVQEAAQVVQEAPQVVQEAPQIVQEAPQVVQEAPQSVPQEAPVIPDNMYPQYGFERHKKNGKKFGLKFGKKAFIILGVAVIAVIGIIVSCLLLFGSDNKTIDFKKYPVIFFNDDDELCFKQNGNNTIKTLGDEDDISESSFGITDNGGKFFFIDDGDLYSRETGKKDSAYSNVLIDTNVGSYEFSPDGKTLFYVKGDNLYRYSGKKSTLFAQDVEYIANIADISKDFKAVIYVNEDDEYIYTNGKYEKKLVEDGYAHFIGEQCNRIAIIEWDYDYNECLKVVGTGKNDKPFKVDSSIKLRHWTRDAEAVYYIKNDTLYYSNCKQKSVKVLDEAVSVFSANWYDRTIGGIMTSSGDETFAKNEDGDLYYIDGKNATKLCDDFENFYSENIIVCDDGDKVYLRDGKKLYEIDVPRYVMETYPVISGGYGYCIDRSGTLKKVKIGKKTINFNSATDIMEEVEDFIVLPDGKTLLVETYNGEIYLYDGKIKMVSSEEVEKYCFVDGKKMVFVDEENDLYYFNGSMSELLAKDVNDVLVLGLDNIYFISNDYDLYKASKSGIHKLIQKDVSWLPDLEFYFESLSSHSELELPFPI